MHFDYTTSGQALQVIRRCFFLKREDSAAMRNAVVYARFSSDKQTEDSIEAQLRACREYAAAHGLQIVDIYTDEAISGKGSKTAGRRQYQRLLRDCEKGLFEVILIHKYDRIARNLGEHVNLEKRLSDKEITLIATAQDFGNTKEAKIMRALMWSLSEYYIDNLAEETRKGLREKALKGLHTGGYAPFGYDVSEGKYIVNELEAMYVRRIFDAALHREGFTALIEEMERAGIRGKRGKPLKYPQIYEILRNEKYTGVYLYSPIEEKDRSKRREKPNAIKIENALPEIISKAKFTEVQRIMDGRKQTGRKANYLCSGLVYCQCGAKMHGMTSKRKGHEYPYFTCSQHCGASVVRMEEVDRAAVEYLQELLSDENQLAIAEALRQYQAGSGFRMKEFKAVLRQRIQDKQRQYSALMDNLSSGELPPEILSDIGEKMKQLKAEITALEHTEPPKDFTAETIRNWLESIKAAPTAEAVRLLIERIDVNPNPEKEKTAFNIQSTLKTVLRKNGCGGLHHCFPEILFRFTW